MRATEFEILKAEIKALRREQKLRDGQLELQAKEYKRRLKDLNGEAARLRSMQQNYIPREVFDRTINTLNDKVQVVTVWQNESEGKDTGKESNKGDVYKIISIIALIITVLVLLITKFSKQ